MQRRDTSHFLHPFTDPKALVEKAARVIVRGEGIYVWDADGHKLLDAMSAAACANLGYGRSELIEAATTQLEQLAFYPNALHMSVAPAIDLAESLCELAPPACNHFFFTNSGSEATDTAFRLALRYWSLAGRPLKTTILARRESYHGSTVFASALQRTGETRRQHDAAISGIELIGAPNHRRDGDGLSSELFGIRAALWLEAKILEVGPERIAAFIAEPIQSAAGFIGPPPLYWAEIQRICHKHDILLIVDEVVCGFGRLGTWFGCQYFDIKPDLMTFAKGVTSAYIPLGGVAVADRVAEALIERGGVFDHGFTSSGHPVACAVALETIRVMQREGLLRRIGEESAPCLRSGFLDLQDHPLAGAVETCGMTAALNLVTDDGDAFYPDDHAEMICRDACLEEGVIVRVSGSRLSVAPPLVIGLAQIDEMIGRIRKGLDRTRHYLSAGPRGTD